MDGLAFSHVFLHDSAIKARLQNIGRILNNIKTVTMVTKYNSNVPPG